MDLTEAEDIKKRWWQEYMEKLYKKDLNDLDNHDGVITHQRRTSWSAKSAAAAAAAAAAAKSLQSCLTLCDPIDGSPAGSPVPGTLQARTLEWVVISSSNA